MDTSLVDLGLAVVCEACEGEIDVLDDTPEQALCRQCGIAFLVDVVTVDARRTA